MSTGKGEVEKPYSLEGFTQEIEGRVRESIAQHKKLSLNGLPIVEHDDLLATLEVLLKKYVAEGNADGFIILFHTFMDACEELSRSLTWDTNESYAGTAMNVQVSRAIKELWEQNKGKDVDDEKSDGYLLLKLAMKLGVVRGSDISRIKDLVGVDTSRGDRM